MNSLPEHPKTFGILKEVLGIQQDAKIVSAEVIGASDKRKTDVEFVFVANEGSKVQDSGASSLYMTISSKSFTGAGYNHLERRGFFDFCGRNQISKNDQELLGNLVLQKAGGGRGRALVPQQNQVAVRSIFNRIDVGSSAILGNDHPKFLALYSMASHEFKLYHIMTQVIPLVSQKKITFTKQGGNISINDYIVIQRKGSEGGDIGNSRTDLNHGSNDIQIKLRAKKFFEEVEPLARYRVRRRLP